MPTPGHLVARRQPLEVRARHVIQQQVVVDRKQLPQAVAQVVLDVGLVPDQMVEQAVQAILVDPLGCDAEEVLEGRALVPTLGHVELARRFAQARDHQDGGDQRPGNVLMADGQHLGA
ncbi:MAG: hypothetical protein U0587_04740 [Candidatus Binatia bacterium]